MLSSNQKNATVPVDSHRDLMKPHKDGFNRLGSRAILWKSLICSLILASAFFLASVLRSVHSKEESRLYAIDVVRRERVRPLWASLELPQDENGKIIKEKMIKADPIRATLEDTDNRNDQHPVIMGRVSELLKDDQHRQEVIEQKLRTNLDIIGNVEGVVTFPDNVLLLLVKVLFSIVDNFLAENYECVYENIGLTKRQVIVLPIISIDQKEEGSNDYFVRCLQINIEEEEELIFGNNNSSNSYITLQQKGKISDESPIFSKMRYNDMISWKSLVYESMSLQNSVLLFVKGGSRSFRPHKVEEYPRGLECVYGGKVRTEVLMVAQEVVHCKKPPLELEEALEGETISLWDRRRSIHFPSVARFQPRYGGIEPTIPSVDMIPSMSSSNSSSNSSTANETPSTNRREKMTMMKKTKKKYFVCLCSMIWNQARFLPEWIIYHSALGIERWFLYDNNSDDRTEMVIQELRKTGINISRHSWPWIKTQEAGFSHCALRAKPECEWMLFIDVDEFVYPKGYINGSINSYIDGYVNPAGSNLGGMLPGIITRRTRKSTRHPRISLEGTENSIIEYSSIGEIRIKCHNFGPSRLSTIPEAGVSVGYNCRMRKPERHKSILRLDAIHPSLLNVVHHFLLKPGYAYTIVQWPEVVINHYKYQVWDVFKQKFVRRVSSYVADWGEKQNMGSGDRTPGLGTEPVQPRNWANRFCQIHDNGLKDFVLLSFSDPHTSRLPWPHQ